MSKKELEDPVTTYTIRGRNFPVIMVFKYGLNGVFKSLQLTEGEFTDKFREFLFHPERFPYLESNMEYWKSRKNVEVTIGEADVSFENFWNLYKLKVGKIDSEKLWNKLKKQEQIKAIQQIKAYEGFLRRRGTAKMHPERYLRKKHFNDQFNSIH